MEGAEGGCGTPAWTIQCCRGVARTIGASHQLTATPCYGRYAPMLPTHQRARRVRRPSCLLMRSLRPFSSLQNVRLSLFLKLMPEFSRLGSFFADCGCVGSLFCWILSMACTHCWLYFRQKMLIFFSTTKNYLKKIKIYATYFTVSLFCSTLTHIVFINLNECDLAIPFWTPFYLLAKAKTF